MSTHGAVPRRIRLLALLTGATLVAALVMASAGATHPRKPTSLNQPVHDGCTRTDVPLGLDLVPAWVYVYRNPTIRMAKGIVRVSHASLEDSILQHRSYDYNGNLVPDPRYQWTVAGSRTEHTSNYTPPAGPTEGTEEFARLHFEWESKTLPFFAWPTDGDRAMLWGSWIWDCGHWQGGSENNTGGPTTGERSEFHPLNGIAVQRKASARSSRGDTETDVFISNMGDGAHAVEQCALSHRNPDGTYDSGYKACAVNKANRLQPLEKSYRFFVPAPPKPGGGATLRYRIVKRISRESGSQTVRRRPNGIDVTVKLRGAGHVVRYGKSFFVGWSEPPRQPPRKVRVTFKSLLVKTADTNPALPDPSGANWNLYFNLNGSWHLLNNWIPKLTTHVHNNERFVINRTVTIFVPHGSGIWLEVQGRECDEPAGTVILGNFANLLYPCPANKDEQNPDLLQVFSNDDTGTILDRYKSPAAAAGPHTSTSKAIVRWPHSRRVGFGNEPQGQGAYELTYLVHHLGRGS